MVQKILQQCRQRRWITALPMRLHVIAALGWYLTHGSGVSFAVGGGQVPLLQLRAQDGLSLKTSANEKHKVENFSKQAKKLLVQIADAGQRGDWKLVQRLFRNYSGRDNPIYNAMLHAAYTCGQYQKGVEIYERMCNSKIPKTAPTFSAALKIFAELGQFARIRSLWAEATKTCPLEVPLAAARIDAAAAEGDIEAAAQVLDQMTRDGVSIDVAHITSAIRACWRSSGNGHNAAMFLYKLMLDLNLQPNVATFSCLIGAHQTAPLDSIKAVYAEMKKKKVAASPVFVETFLVTVLKKPKQERWNANGIDAKLRQRSPARLLAARDALIEFRMSNVELSALSRRIEGALQTISDTQA
mmetsp:Transcript_52419/g.122299  ORF Transcript_52419/g.122299 Transcript_52419/m.122299 type:complete len:356 (-) Transcript_52419:95-1162(-)